MAARSAWSTGHLPCLPGGPHASPLSAHAGVRVSIGIGLPVVVAPASVVVAPPPAVVYSAPVVVAPPPWCMGRRQSWSGDIMATMIVYGDTSITAGNDRELG
jgi:hypothetical protein